ncbi:MAG: glycosyl transferase [Clostridia bacterium]|nr:glycosyl transferase [Clostridia bacterium]
MKEKTRQRLLSWFQRLDRYNALRILSDKAYIKLRFRLNFNKKLDLRNPQTYNEKLQWLKLYYRNPLYPTLVDKYLVKEYVSKQIGEKYIIPTLGVWDNFDELDFDSLPDQFVLKCTHDSGGLVICHDKSVLDREHARAKIEKSLRVNYYWHGREWPYKQVRPRIIAEKLMMDSKDQAEEGLTDYKFFCFDGEPKAMFIATDRAKKDIETKFDFFDMEFNHLPFTNGHPNADKPIQKPEQFDLMVELCRELSKGHPHVRVDFYESEGHIYFGELTFFHWGGMVPFEPEEWDYTFGSWLQIPEKKG